MNESLFYQLERRLLRASRIDVKCAINSSGSVEAEFSGEWIVRSGNVVDIKFTGEFSSTPSDPWLASDGKTMRGGSTNNTFDVLAAPSLGEALVIGFTRMGMLHNLARLSFGLAPEGGDGGASDWVKVSGFIDQNQDINSGQEARVGPFDLTVAGIPSGAATLHIDKANGVPLQRRQTVSFPEGDMNAIERYERIKIED